MNSGSLRSILFSTGPRIPSRFAAGGVSEPKVAFAGREARCGPERDVIYIEQ
jgi:hypothetical protein